MIKTFKVMLCPNNKQNTCLFKCAGTSRFIYNWVLEYQQINYEFGYNFVNDYELRKVLTRLKRENPKFKWLNDYSNNIAKQAVKDACLAYQRFFKGVSKYPNFKSKKRTKPSFYLDTAKIQITGTHVKLEKLTPSKKSNKQKLNWIRLAEQDRIPVGAKYTNPRITYDGINWWLSVGVKVPDEKISKASNEGIGIDVGIKNLAICSDGNVYKDINKTKTVKELKKKKRRLQRKISRKYEKNKKGKIYCKTKNIKKCEKQVLKINHRLTSIRSSHLHQITSEITKREPSFIVIEDLNVKGMMKNKHLAKAIQEQSFYEFRRQLTYKSYRNGVELIIANRFYPSSKKCCKCGNIKKDLKLKDRVYVCAECKNEIDRDYQASINLRDYKYLCQN